MELRLGPGGASSDRSQRLRGERPHSRGWEPSVLCHPDPGAILDGKTDRWGVRRVLARGGSHADDEEECAERGGGCDHAVEWHCLVSDIPTMLSALDPCNRPIGSTAALRPSPYSNIGA